MQPFPTRVLRTAWSVKNLTPAVIAAYLAVYVALYWVSYIHPMRGINITPWNPQSALAVALLVWKPQAWWLVLLGNVGGDLLVYHAPSSWAGQLSASASLTAGYAATAAALARWPGRGTRLAARKDFLLFLLVVGAGALLTALAYVLVLAGFGMVPPHQVLVAIHRAWIGDAVGFLVTLPLLMVLASRARRHQAAVVLQSVECWLIALVAVAGAYAVFAQTGEDPFKYFYLLFLPVAWSAARFGVIGAVGSAMLVQILLIAAAQSLTYRPLTVFELQALMATLAAMGLLLGSTVEEREEAAQALQSSLRLAAAGDMAAALAHELNQPLTAVRAYAKASQLMAQRQQGEEALPLSDATTKLVNEVDRASDIVKRLRDFFRERATELQPTALPPLLEEAIRSHAAHAEARGVRLDMIASDDTLPMVWLDRVQILVVLRNLIANALEAAQHDAGQDAWVKVKATADRYHVTVAVLDSGPGIAVEHVAHIFDSRQSSKPGGMGIGLGISRSIVETHGGRMWVEPGPGGRVFFTLPLSTDHRHD